MPCGSCGWRTAPAASPNRTPSPRSAAPWTSPRQAYGSWREHADGFIVGRTQWCETIDKGSSEYVGGMAIALHHPESPWVTTPLR
ncbi:DUF1266 domain-containing protein [Corynebacterium variabile]|uniref:DUF1266 domain-containing protein n=1 Tax=Corynebacterium variabile TaxID=1727 RepID=UPI0035E4132A